MFYFSLQNVLPSSQVYIYFFNILIEVELHHLAPPFHPSNTPQLLTICLPLQFVTLFHVSCMDSVLYIPLSSFFKNSLQYKVHCHEFPTFVSRNILISLTILVFNPGYTNLADKNFLSRFRIYHSTAFRVVDDKSDIFLMSLLLHINLCFPFRFYYCFFALQI